MTIYTNNLIVFMVYCHFLCEISYYQKRIIAERCTHR